MREIDPGAGQHPRLVRADRAAPDQRVAVGGVLEEHRARLRQARAVENIGQAGEHGRPIVRDTEPGDVRHHRDACHPPREPAPQVGLDRPRQQRRGLFAADDCAELRESPRLAERRHALGGKLHGHEPAAHRGEAFLAARFARGHRDQLEPVIGERADQARAVVDEVPGLVGEEDELAGDRRTGDERGSTPAALAAAPRELKPGRPAPIDFAPAPR